MGIGDFIRDRLSEGLSPEAILPLVLAQFPTAKTTVSSIRWYRTNPKRTSHKMSQQPLTPAKSSVPAPTQPTTDSKRDPVVAAAQCAFSIRLKGSNNVSEHTKNAQSIAKAWRGAVHELDPDRFHIEAMVTPDLDQRIDVVDMESGWAYEFKVSGNNAPAEFYKDIVKVLLWNEKRKKKLVSLVFITEEALGKPFLSAPMPCAYIEYLAQKGLEVSVEYVRYE